MPEHVMLCWGGGRISNIIYDANFEVTTVLELPCP